MFRRKALQLKLRLVNLYVVNTKEKYTKTVVEVSGFFMKT